MFYVSVIGIPILDIVNRIDGESSDDYDADNLGFLSSGPVFNSGIHAEKGCFPTVQFILSSESNEKLCIKTNYNEKVLPFLCVDFSKTSLEVAEIEENQLLMKKEEEEAKEVMNDKLWIKSRTITALT